MMLRAPTPEADGAAPSPIRLRILSLGAGVQSTTLALLAAHGVVGPMPDCAIFADTGWEPKAVMDHLAWLMSPNVLPFPVHIVSAGNIRDNLLDAASGERWAFRRHPNRACQRPCRCRHDPAAMHDRVQDRAHPPQGPRVGRADAAALAQNPGR